MRDDSITSPSSEKVQVLFLNEIFDKVIKICSYKCPSSALSMNEIRDEVSHP